jgi:hypothetical protein
MRADICDPKDNEAVERFRDTLLSMGAKIDDQAWAMGVDLYRVSIEGESLLIFRDTWSVDIEGSELLVRKILDNFKKDTV